MQNEIILGEIMDKKKIWESYRFPLILLGGIILGAILGAILGEKATILAPIGNVFINLLFMVVVPFLHIFQLLNRKRKSSFCRKLLGT